jgi:hypothetical protein
MVPAFPALGASELATIYLPAIGKDRVPVLAPSSLFCIYFCRWSLPGILRINNMSGSQGYYRFFTSIHSFTAG